MTTLRLNQPRNQSVFDSVVPNAELLVTLVEMGWSSEHAQGALIAVKNKHLAAAIEWLLANPADQITTTTTSQTIPTPTPTPIPASTTDLPTPTHTTTSSTSTAGTHTPSPSNVDHTNTATPEDQTLKSRIDLDAKRKFELQKREQELKKLQQERQKQREEEKLIKQRIADMRRDRANKFKPTPTNTSPKPTPTPAPTKPAPSTSSTAKALLQIRLPDGRTVRKEFEETQRVADVYEFVASKIGKTPSEFILLQPGIPKVEYTTPEAVALTLHEANLTPRGSLTVMNAESRGVVKVAETPLFPSRPYYPGHYTPEGEEEEEELSHLQPMAVREDLTYEELLALEEKIGSVEVGATEEEISRLPTFTYSDPEQDQDPMCLVCQMEFEAGEEQLGLPCGHRYHKPCITAWLAKKRTCPKCLQRI